MDDFDDDPLDLLEDDNDGIFEVDQLLNGNERKPVQSGTGCSILLFSVSSITLSAGWIVIKMLV